MRIAQVCPRYYPYFGGVETHVQEISERLVKKGFVVEILTTDPSGKLRKEDVINGVKVKRFRSWAPNENYHVSRELKNYLKKNSDNYNVLHAHGYHDFPALHAALTKNINKLVFTPHYHGKGHSFFRSLLHIPYKLLGKNIFRKADKIICVSNYEKCLVMNKFKIGEEKIAFIPNGVNFEEFKDIKRRRKDYTAILCVCRLEKYKGIDSLIEILRTLDDDICLDIVGKGPYKWDLLRKVNKLQMEDRVRFYCDLPRKELLQMYVDADIFVLLSKYEAFGLSVADALASKTPCIVANTSALKDFVDNKYCFGIDFPINNIELSRLIEEVIGKEVKKISLLDWDDVVRKIERVYDFESKE